MDGRGWLRHAAAAHSIIRPRDVVIAIALTMLLAGIPSGLAGRATANPPNDFVTRSGRGLVLDGQPYTFTGFNIYNANSRGECGGDLVDNSGLDDALNSMGSGVGVIRAWFFQDMATVGGVRDWTAFDQTLAVARAHGKRVIATLANQWQDCEPQAGYKDKTWYESGYQARDPGGTTSYYQYAQDAAARYAGNTTLLAWQLINESQVTDCGGYAADGETCLHPGACPSGPGPAADLYQWAAAVSAAIKAADPNHLVSIGTIGSGQCGAQGDEYQTLHAIPTVDLCEFHDDGNPVDALPGDQYNGLPKRVAQCAALNKPLVMGEVGMPRNLTGQGADAIDLGTRAASVEAKLDAEFTHGVVGAVVWDWSNVPGDPTSWEVGPGDPMLPAVQRWGGGVISGAGFDVLGLGEDFTAEVPPQVIPAHIAGSPPAVQVAPGDGYTLALDADGSVWAWGSGAAGQLGLGPITQTMVPARVTGLPPIIKISAKQSVSLALATDGSVWAWGDNSLGELGDGTTTSRAIPEQVPGLAGVVDVATGFATAYAVLTDGSVWAWGGGSGTPAPVAGLPPVRAIAGGGRYAVALARDGGVWTWGLNNFGQLGDGGPVNINGERETPAQVTGLPEMLSVSAGDGHVLALGLDGTVWAWGDDIDGQLGDGQTSSSSVPARVTLPANALAVAAGGHHSVVQLDDGSVWAWGYNAAGELGPNLPILTPTTSPVQMQGLEGRYAGAVAAGEFDSYVLADPLSPSVTVPGAPSIITAYTVDHGGVVRWQPPTSDGGIVITSYTITASTGQSLVVPATFGADSMQAEIDGLTVGSAVTMTVAATNEVGTGPASDPSLPFVVATFPGVPANVIAATSGASQATVTWSAPASDGDSPIVFYSVVTSPGGARVTVDAPSTTAVITGLAPGTYTFTVRAINQDVGGGPFSEPSNAVPVGLLDHLVLSPNPAIIGVGGSQPFIAEGSDAFGFDLGDRTSATTFTIGPNGSCSVNVCTATSGGLHTVTGTDGSATGSAALHVQVAQSITFANITAKTFDKSPLTVSPSATSGLPVVLTSTTTPVCTANALVITFVTTGTCTIVANQPGNADWLPAPPATRTFTISKGIQSIAFANITAKTMAQSPYAVAPTATSGLVVALSSTTAPVCTVTGFVITFVAPGSCSITANQVGDGNWLAAAAVTRTFTVSLAAQTITFATITAKTMLQSPLTVSPTASSGLAATLTSSTTPVCTVSGFVITFISAGSCTITATQAGNGIYAAAPAAPRTFTISQVTQTITFVSPGSSTLAQSPLTVSGQASSGLPVLFTTSTPAVCTAGGSNGTLITLLTIGSCTVTASQAGSAVYKSASQARTFSVTQATQSITFGTVPTASLLQGSVTMTATVSSGLPVNYTTSTGAVCTAGGANGATITLIKTGNCRVVASQAGNAIWKAAPNVAQTFSVIAGKLTQTITFGPLADRSVSQPPETLAATASSGLAVTLVASPAATCTLGGTVLTLQNLGTCTITASQAGNAVYLAATPVVQSFTVTATGFVQASGAALTLNGQPFHIFGASIYETSNHGATVDPPDPTFALAAQGHLNTLRLIDIFNEDGTDANAPYSAADWAREDALVARAQAAGLHVVIDFSDFRNWWVNRQIVVHDTQTGDDWATACRTVALGHVTFATLDPYSVAARPDWTAFMTYVANRVNTVSGMPYRNDPTILAVSMAGEPWGAGSSECGEATTQDELTAFYAWALGEWKSLDANHLRSNGGLTGTYFGVDGNGDPIPSGQQIDGVAIFALPDNTLPSLHTYPPAGTLADGQTPVMGAEAQRLGKPWFTEEFGWTQGTGDAVRAADYQWLYDEQVTYGSAGSLFWNLGSQGTSGTFDVNPSTPLTWQVVLDHAPSP